LLWHKKRVNNFGYKGVDQKKIERERERTLKILYFSEVQKPLIITTFTNSQKP